MNALYNLENSRTKKLLRWLFIWQGFHLFALFFTSFRINFQFGSPYKLLFNLFDASVDTLSSDLSGRQEHFWPFVKFYNKQSVISLDWKSYNDLRFFNGLFYNYDFSEFLFYTVLGAIVYYVLFKRLTSNIA